MAPPVKSGPRFDNMISSFLLQERVLHPGWAWTLALLLLLVLLLVLLVVPGCCSS